MKSYKYLSFITGIFTATLLISNTLDTKLFSLGPLSLSGIVLFPRMTLPCGIILFPLAYIFGDVLTEVYGYAASRTVIWTGLIGMILMTLTYEVAIILPPDPAWKIPAETFNQIFGPVFRIVMASIAAYLIGEFCNSYILAKIKVRMSGRAMPVRFVISTIVGQAADTTVFVLIAYIGTYSAGDLLRIILSGWGFKVVWEIIALPLTVRIVNYLKKAEGEDHFDIKTNFNPFRLSQGDSANSSPRVDSAAT